MEYLGVQTQPPEIGGLFKKGIVNGDRYTLRTLVRRSLQDVVNTFQNDTYLLRKLSEAEDRDSSSSAYSAIDSRLTRAVQFHLTNREPNERVRGAKITTLSVADLTTRKARCVIVVKAWGCEVRESLELTIPIGA